MILTIALAATPLPPNALSVSISGGLAMSESESYEGQYLELPWHSGVRLQYDRRDLTGPGFLGAVMGYERVAGDTNVGLIGPVVGGRWGDMTRGTIRFAGGFALADGALFREASRSVGWFLDIEGELSHRNGAGWEGFLALPIFTIRRLHVSDANVAYPDWYYAVPVIPMAANIGVRRLF